MPVVFHYVTFICKFMFPRAASMCYQIEGLVFIFLLMRAWYELDLGFIECLYSPLFRTPLNILGLHSMKLNVRSD